MKVCFLVITLKSSSMFLKPRRYRDILTYSLICTFENNCFGKVLINRVERPFFALFGHRMYF